jgi:hypothetical protein
LRVIHTRFDPVTAWRRAQDGIDAADVDLVDPRKLLDAWNLTVLKAPENVGVQLGAQATAIVSHFLKWLWPWSVSFCGAAEPAAICSLG